jgi:hypothetical protein
MAWAALGGVVWIAATIVMRGFEPKTNRFTGAVYTSFGQLDGAELGWLALAVVGLAILAGISVAALRGRISSLLTRDVEEMSGGRG